MSRTTFTPYLKPRAEPSSWLPATAERFPWGGKRIPCPAGLPARDLGAGGAFVHCLAVTHRQRYSEWARRPEALGH